MLRTYQCSRILLDGVDSLPSLRLGECNNVTTNACKAINQYCLIRRDRSGNMPCNCAESVSTHSTRMCRCSLHCNWLWGHAKPSVFSHPYALVIFGEDAKALVVISAQAISEPILENVELYYTDFWTSQGISFKCA